MQKPVHLQGYDIYVAKNSSVNGRMLDNSGMRPVVERKIELMLINPDAPSFRLHGPLHWLRRTHVMDNWRLYLRIFKNRHVAVIVAFDTAGNTKREEKSGAMDLQFMELLQQYEHFDYSRVRPFVALEEAEEEVPVEETVSSYRPRFWLDIEDTTVDQAEKCLASLTSTGTKKPVFFFDYILRKAEASDRVLVDPIAEGIAKDPQGVKKCRLDMAAYFTKRGAPLAVRYDSLTEKLLVVPKAKLGIYCYGLSGRR